MKLRILLVDDHQIFREALRSLLERMPDLAVVGEAGDGREAFSLVRELLPDIICMDIGMPSINGIELTRQLTAMYPALKVIALTTYADHVYVIDMINAGASAYVTKSAGGEELIRAIEAVTHDHQYLCPGIADEITRAMLQRNCPLLSDRERQILRLVAEGQTSAKIAEQLGIAASTVNVHRRNIMRKLDIHTAVDLTRYAINMGLIGR